MLVASLSFVPFFQVLAGICATVWPFHKLSWGEGPGLQGYMLKEGACQSSLRRAASWPAVGKGHYRRILRLFTEATELNMGFGIFGIQVEKCYPSTDWQRTKTFLCFEKCLTKRVHFCQD